MQHGINRIACTDAATALEPASPRRRRRPDRRGGRPAQGHGLRHGRRPAGGGRPLHRLRPDGGLRAAGLVARAQRQLHHHAGDPGRHAARAGGARRRPGKLVTATATLAALVGAMLLLARLLRLGFVANFISAPVLTGFKAGIGLVIVLDQVPKLLGMHITKAGLLPRPAQRRAAPSRGLAADPGGGRGDVRRPDRHGAAVAAFAGAAGRGGRRHRRVVVLRPAGSGRVDRRPDSAGFPSLTLPDLALVEHLAPGRSGIALMSFTETIAAGRAFARPGDPPINANRELVATGAANSGGALFGAMPAGGGTSQTAVVRSAGGQSQKASLVTAGAALATMLLLAPLLGLMPHATLAAVVIVYSVGLIQPAEFRAIRKVRTMEFRWALDRLRRRAGVRHAEGHRGGHHRVDDRAGEPDRATARVRHRPQARGRRAATAVARAPRRRDLRGPADRAAGGAPVLRQCAETWRSRSTRWSRSTSRACWRWT